MDHAIARNVARTSLFIMGAGVGGLGCAGASPSAAPDARGADGGVATTSAASRTPAASSGSARFRRRASSVKKPAGVPAEFVITPSGFLHPSCVVQLARDEVLGPDLVIRTLDGEERDTIAPCAYPRYDLRGRPISEAFSSTRTAPSHTKEKVLPAAAWDGYPVLYSYTGSAWGTYLSDEWTVPPFPTNVGDGEVIFLWNAVQTTNALLQPVLGFNDVGNNMEWQISSWNCCTSGIAGQTAGVTVNPGDVIQGTVQASNCDSTGICQNWTITATDTTCGQSEVLNTTSPNGAPQNIDPGVLETYGVTSCDMLPANGQESFFNHTLNDANGNPVSLSYQLITLVDPDPSLPACGYTGTATDTSYTLVFGDSPTGGVTGDPSCCVPAGSYSASCAGCSAEVQSSSCTLTCKSCGTISGTQNPGPTLALPCHGTVSNNNGVLECDGSQGTGDAGSDGATSGSSSSGSGSSSGADSGDLGSSGGSGSSSGSGSGASSGSSGGGSGSSSGQASGTSTGSSGSTASNDGGRPGEAPLPERIPDLSCGCRVAGGPSREIPMPGPWLAAVGSLLVARGRRRR